MTVSGSAEALLRYSYQSSRCACSGRTVPLLEVAEQRFDLVVLQHPNAGHESPLRVFLDLVVVEALLTCPVIGAGK